MRRVAPFGAGRLTWSKDGKTLTGTLPVSADLKIKLVGAEVRDGAFLATTFEVAEDSPLHDPNFDPSA